MKEMFLHWKKGGKNPASKGFIFSVDALGAIAVVIVLGAIWILFVHHSGGMFGMQIEKTVKDEAMVSLYTNHQTVESAADSAHDDLTTVFCKKYFIYDNASNEAKEWGVCEGVTQ